MAKRKKSKKSPHNPIAEALKALQGMEKAAARVTELEAEAADTEKSLDVVKAKLQEARSAIGAALELFA